MNGSPLYINITVFFKGEPIQTHSFPNREIVIGRSGECDIILDNAGVSRQHAKIESYNGQLEVTDLDSGNGTFINDEPVQRATLQPNDDVRIGKFTIQASLSATASEQTNSATASANQKADQDTSKTVFLRPEERQQILQQKAHASAAPSTPSQPSTVSRPTAKKKNATPWAYILIGVIAGFLLRSLLELF